MKLRSVLPVLSLSVVVALAACSGASEQTERAVVADYVFTNGKVYTVSEAQPWAEAIAAQGNEIVYVGDNQAASAFVGDSTTVKDLAGKVVHRHWI